MRHKAIRASKLKHDFRPYPQQTQARASRFRSMHLMLVIIVAGEVMQGRRVDSSLLVRGLGEVHRCIIERFA